jgi:hypothetical protein
MKDQNISIAELNAINSIADVVGKCHNSYKSISKVNTTSAIQEFYKCYRWLKSCSNLIDTSADYNSDFANKIVNSFSLDKYGLIESKSRQDYPIFIYKKICLEIDRVIAAILELENLSTLNKGIYLDCIHSARISITNAKYLIEFEMEYLFHQ